jgi:hypothetical protein
LAGNECGIPILSKSPQPQFIRWREHTKEAAVSCDADRFRGWMCHHFTCFQAAARATDDLLSSWDNDGVDGDEPSHLSQQANSHEVVFHDDIQTGLLLRRISETLSSIYPIVSRAAYAAALCRTVFGFAASRRGLPQESMAMASQYNRQAP